MHAPSDRKPKLTILLIVLAMVVSACGSIGINNEEPKQTANLTQEQIRATVQAELRATEQAGAGAATEATQSAETPVSGTAETAQPEPGATEASTPGTDGVTENPTSVVEEETPDTPTEEETPVPAPTEEDDGGSVVEIGTPEPEATETPRAANATISRAVLVSGKPNPKATKGATKFDLLDRRISLVGDLEGGPEYGSLKAEWELVAVPGRNLQEADRKVLTQYLSVRQANPFTFSAEFDLDSPPSEGTYQVKLSIDDKVIKRVPFTITAKAPRLIAKPGKQVQGGTGRLVIKIPKGTKVWEYQIIDSDLREVVQQYGNSLKYEETPGVHQLPAGTYILQVSPSLGGSNGGLYRVTVAAGRETTVQLGAIKIVSGQVPQSILLLDKVTGRPAGRELSGGSSDDSLLKGARAIPVGRYEVYFRSGSGPYVKVGDLEVRPGLVSTLRV
ncbi:MAG: hypothetical protein H0V86_13650 [Chloroflexia bacterium]|nr:hypothetical protein [Chloroflexia bacterium]